MPSSVIACVVQGVQDRFRTLENVRLPDMDNRIERASTALVSKASMQPPSAWLPTPAYIMYTATRHAVPLMLHEP